jgi:hypothetical protein
MQNLPDFVPASSHHLKPLMRDGSQFTSMLIHPRIDGGIAFDSTVESQQFRFHRPPLSAFEICDYVVPLPFLQQNPSPGTVGGVERGAAPDNQVAFYNPDRSQTGPSATLPESLFLKALTAGLLMIHPAAVHICRPMMVRSGRHT